MKPRSKRGKGDGNTAKDTSEKQPNIEEIQNMVEMMRIRHQKDKRMVEKIRKSLSRRENIDIQS